MAVMEWSIGDRCAGRRDRETTGILLSSLAESLYIIFKLDWKRWWMYQVQVCIRKRKEKQNGFKKHPLHQVLSPHYGSHMKKLSVLILMIGLIVTTNYSTLPSRRRHLERTMHVLYNKRLRTIEIKVNQTWFCSHIIAKLQFGLDCCAYPDLHIVIHQPAQDWR